MKDFTKYAKELFQNILERLKGFFKWLYDLNEKRIRKANKIKYSLIKKTKVYENQVFNNKPKFIRARANL